MATVELSYNCAHYGQQNIEKWNAGSGTVTRQCNVCKKKNAIKIDNKQIKDVTAK